jgi:hypothetical protein
VAKRVLDHDLTKVYGDRFDPWENKTEKNKLIRVLYWGDEVEMPTPDQATDDTESRVDVRIYNYKEGQIVDGYIKKRKDGGKYLPLKVRSGAGKNLLEVTFVDVQQGDATIIRTPDRKLLIVDGGEEVFLARLLASIFPGTTAATPLEIDALVITHGDADHFSGLARLADAATHTEPRKRLHAKILRCFHNGLVKLPSTKIVNGQSKDRPDTELLGATVKVGSTHYVTDLWNDPRSAPLMNDPFTDWANAMAKLMDGTTDIRRLQIGDHGAFDAFRPEVDIEVLGPIVENVAGQPALRFFNSSASHTINGHSVVLRMRHGNVHFLMGGDLNTDAEKHLREHLQIDPNLTLRAEILKVPHHGSHEFEQAFLNEVNPVVSVVSSGDERASKDYVHPRANLMAGLGRAARGPEPLVFVTELAAFFAYRGGILPESHRSVGSGGLEDLPVGSRRPHFFAHERLVFGALFVRTDGERVLIATESAHSNIKEAYAFRVDAGGNVTREDLR